VEFNLNNHPKNIMHISAFCGENGSIVKMNMVSVVDTVFSYGPLAWSMGSISD
jgi:hypothetical protein